MTVAYGTQRKKLVQLDGPLCRPRSRQIRHQPAGTGGGRKGDLREVTLMSICPKVGTRSGAENSKRLERPRTTISWRGCKKGSADAKVHAKAELCHNGCSTLLPSCVEAGYARSRTVDTHHTESRYGGRVVVGLDRLANIPSSPTGVRQRNTGFSRD